MIQVQIKDLAPMLEKMTLGKYYQACDKARAEWVKVISPYLETEIVATILRGQSPIAGEGRFVGYSPSYLTKIKFANSRKMSSDITILRMRMNGKKQRPINLKLTGDMLGSIYTRTVANGLEVGFKSKIAEYHNDLGAGRSKVIRRMLPNKPGEEFSKVIMKNIRDIYDSLLGKELQT